MNRGCIKLEHWRTWSLTEKISKEVGLWQMKKKRKRKYISLFCFQFESKTWNLGGETSDMKRGQKNLL